ncbi:hypothetical protein FKM82_029862 [Ascaphus truei]
MDNDGREHINNSSHRSGCSPPVQRGTPELEDYEVYKVTPPQIPDLTGTGPDSSFTLESSVQVPSPLEWEIQNQDSWIRPAQFGERGHHGH